MNEQDRKTAVKQIGKPFLPLLGLLQLAFLLLLLATPVIYLWTYWGGTWKLFITALFGILLCNMFYKILTDKINEEIDKALNILGCPKCKGKGEIVDGSGDVPVSYTCDLCDGRKTIQSN